MSALFKRAAACGVAIASIPLLAPPATDAAAPAIYLTGPKRVSLTHTTQFISWKLVNNSGQDLCGTVWIKDASRRGIDFDSIPPYDGKLAVKYLNTMGLWDLTGSPGYVKVCNTTTYPAVQDWRITVKYGARDVLTATRRGGNIRLTSVAKRFGGNYPAQPYWIPDNGAFATFQRYGNGAWHTLATKKIVHQGTNTFTYHHPAVAKYRVLVSERRIVWGTKSNRVTK
jgi:hypothetical protein